MDNLLSRIGTILRYLCLRSDTGVNSDIHYFLMLDDKVLIWEIMEENESHGTEIAGVALFNDLKECLLLQQCKLPSSGVR